MFFIIWKKWEKEINFLHIVFQIVDQHKRKNPFLNQIDEVKSVNNSIQDRVLNPINTYEFGIGISLTLVFGTIVHRFNELTVDQPLENFFVIEILSSIQSNHKSFWFRRKCRYDDFGLFFFQGNFVALSRFVKMVTLFANDDLYLLINIFWKGHLDGAINSERHQPFDKFWKTWIGNTTNTLVLIHSTEFGYLQSLLPQHFSFFRQNCLVKLFLVFPFLFLSIFLLMQLMKFILLSLFPSYLFLHVVLDKLVIFDPVSDLEGFLKKLIEIKWL